MVNRTCKVLMRGLFTTTNKDNGADIWDNFACKKMVTKPVIDDENNEINVLGYFTAYFRHFTAAVSTA